MLKKILAVHLIIVSAFAVPLLLGWLFNTYPISMVIFVVLLVEFFIVTTISANEDIDNLR